MKYLGNMPKVIKRRIRWIMAAFFLCCLGMMLHLGKIQVVYGREYALTAFQQHTLTVTLGTNRGDILDRNRVSLLDSRTVHSLFAFPQLIGDKEEIAHKLEKILGISAEELLTKMKGNTPVVRLKRDLTLEEGKKIMEIDNTGLLIAEEELRYGENALAAHLIGFIGAAEEKNNNAFYRNLYIGKSGIEKSMDEVLRGRGPKEIRVIVDGKGRIIPGRGYRVQQNEKGENIVLTLDARIQRVVEQAIKREGVKGAVVVMDPYSGEILGMASSPNFDPNQIEAALKSEDAPLINRCLSPYIPGSVFKIIIAAAALEEGIADWSTPMDCPGFILVGSRRIRCHQEEGHGEIIMCDALAQSCNVYFIKLGQALGGEKILEYARKFGIGRELGEWFPEADTDHLPEGKRLYIGDVANLSIGQGEISITPLKMACIMAAIVNNGVQPEPYIYKEVINEDGKVLKKLDKKKLTRVISGTNARIIKEMLRETVKTGTGRTALVPGFGSGGKTGTAQVSSTQEANILPHSWFAGFAPDKHPRFVIVVLVENGGPGGGMAASLFREIATKLCNINDF